MERAELVLARPDHLPLAHLDLAPDPLQRMVAAMAGVRSSEGEQADVVVDLVPVSDRRVERRRRALSRAASEGGAGGGGVAGFVREMAYGSGVRSAWNPQSAGSRRTGSGGEGKFAPGEMVFEAQVLLRVAARHPARARALLHQLLAAMEVFSAANRWRPVGSRRLGRRFSNGWARRRGWDRRFATGEFAPARPQWVTLPEIACVLKPPTSRCDAPNVARGGGVVAPAPAGLPVWTGQQGMVPLGQVTGSDGTTYMAGLPARDVLFGMSLGKSGFGKTERALLEMLSMAYGGHGTWFLDPHGAAVERARPYLTHPAVRDRVWEINLGDPRMDSMMACWNPLDMTGRAIEEVQDVVGAVVGGIANGQRWGDGAPRARAILGNAALALSLLSYQLVQAGKPEVQPTVFQIKTLLTDEEWRAAVVEHLPERAQKFWRLTFPKHEASAVPTITNALDLLETSLSLTAFLGGSQSSFDVRRAMDTGAVVMLAPSGTGAGDTLISSLLIFDLFRAAMSRRGAAPEQLRTFFGWMDELAALDSAGGGFIAKIFEQVRKYEVRLMVATQMAMRLSDTTRQAGLQNQSVLSATGADIDEARFIASRLPGVTPETVAGLKKYQYVVSAELGGQRTAPFRVSGVPIHDVLANYYDPAGVPALDAALDRNLRRRPIHEILAHAERLDERILDFLAGHQPGSPAPGTGPGPGGRYGHGGSPADLLVLPLIAGGS
ncbi:ATP/GTP-binding protein [Streptomyces sp. NPDC004031]